MNVLRTFHVAFDPKVNLVPFPDIDLHLLKRIPPFLRGTPIDNVRAQVFTKGERGDEETT